MSKFKVGDEVRLVHNNGNIYDEIEIGDIGIITNVDTDGLCDVDVNHNGQIIKKGIVPNCVRKDDYKWELVTPKREFEVGEKVRLKKYDAMHEGNKGIGIIIPDNIPTTLGTYTVKFDGYTNTYQVKYLELVDKKQTNEVKDKMEDRVDKMEDRMDEMKYRANVMKIEDIKKANIKEARKQCVEEARNAEITEAKAQYNMAVDERDRLDRKITQLEGQKAQQQEILDRFKD